MYRLLSGLHAHLTRKEEFNVIILGLDHAGKTTFLEKVKTVYTPSQPGLNPSQISPTMGQNIGRITLSSSHLQFWDLGGSMDIRPIWEKYYTEADAICWVLDSRDRNRNGWPTSQDLEHLNQQQQQQQGNRINENGKGKAKAKELLSDEGFKKNQSGEGWIELQKVLRHPSIAQANLPLLVIANKQDPINLTHRTTTQSGLPPSTSSAGKQPDRDQDEAEQGLLQGQEHLDGQDGIQPMSVEEIKELFNRLVMESDRSEKARALGLSEAHVVGVSALNGQGIREAINWLFYRVASKGQSRKTLATLSNNTSPEIISNRSSGNGGGGGTSGVIGTGTLGRPIRLNTLSKPGLVTPAMSRNSSYQPK